MFARIGTWQGSPEELENWVARAGEVVKPQVQQVPGLLAGGSRGRQGLDDHLLGERGGDACQRNIPLTKPGANLRRHGSSSDNRKV